MFGSRYNLMIELNGFVYRLHKGDEKKRRITLGVFCLKNKKNGVTIYWDEN